jgi:uncharacterized circularly permuted ATP-grasp superfamily protein
MPDAAPHRSPVSPSSSPIEAWHSLLRPDVELTSAYWHEVAAQMRAARCTFGDRPLCPFLRPFFLTSADEARVKRVSETMARLGERVAQAALVDPALLRHVRLTEAEERLVRIDPGYATASTASRLDAFLLPDSLKFAEYNAESPAGLGYSETLGEIFDALPIMQRFRDRFRTRTYRLADAILDALLESFREWGGSANPPTILITDWREVPTWAEFEMLRDRFIARGVPTIVADPRDLTFEHGALIAQGQPIDLVYRRVLIADILAREAECRPLLDAYTQQAVCMANTLRCKIPHKKAFFAVLTDERYASLFTDDERALIEAHVPWTRVLGDTRSKYGDQTINLLAYVRQHRDRMVIKPNDEYGGSGVTLGWETDASEWDATIERALLDASRGDDGGSWVVQERIPVRRELFPVFDPAADRIVLREMLVDLAPYLFRGRLSGFLTRLSASGLANVTSGGGQVPSFVVD